MSTNKLRFSGEYGLDASGLTLTGVADPVNDTDAATKGFSKNASNLTTGIIASSILGASTLFIGTTAIALNRASGALALTGVTSIDGNAATATKLATARAISFTGDATGSFTFDGSADASAALTLANSGVGAGTYGTATRVPVITVNSKGIVTSIAMSSPITAANLTGGAAGGVVWQSALSTTSITATGTAGQLLQSQGTSAPNWIDPASLTVGKATQADTVAITSGGNNSSYGVTFTDVTTGYGDVRVDTGVSYNPSTKVLSATTFSGSGALLTSIPNTALNNSTVTLGTTQVALGATTTVLDGLTSVTSTNFIGGLTGNASTASAVAVLDDAATATASPLVWVSANSGNQSVKTTSSKLTFTPSTGTLTATKFVGDGSGLTGITSTTTQIQVTPDQTTNTWVYPVWTTNTASGVVGLYNSSQSFAINPSTGAMALKGALQVGASGSAAQYALLDVHSATSSSAIALTMEGTGYTDKNRGVIVHYLPKSGNAGANTFGLRLDGDGSSPDYIDAYLIRRAANPDNSVNQHEFYTGALSANSGSAALKFTINKSYSSFADNIGINVVPSAWHGNFTGLELQYSSGIFSNKNLPNVTIFSNAYYNAQSNWIYKTNNYATVYDQHNGSHRWFNAPSGTAGGTVTFTQAMTLDSNGKLFINTGFDGSRLNIGGGCSLLIGSGSTGANGDQGYWVTIDNTTYRGYGIQLNSSNQMAIYIGDNSNNSWNNPFILDSSGTMLCGNNVGIATSGNGGIAIIPNNGGVGNSQINIGHVTSSGNGSGYLVFYFGTSAVGSVSQNGSSAVSYNTSSDYRLKTNVQPMTGSLTRISQLKPVTYDWILDGTAGEGFIAHELAEVCPQAVTGAKDAVDKDGNPVYQGIDTSFLVGLLVGGIQEQQAVIEAQQQTITNLQTTISDILTRLTALETKVG